MGTCRVVRPDTETLAISRGDTITVRRRLNAGERRQMFAAMYQETKDGLRLHPVETGMAHVLAYLLDWSLVNLDGTPLKIADQPREAVRAILDSLDPDSFTEILSAIEAHEARMEKERAAEKNAPVGETPSSAISPSLGTTAGVTSGSVN